MAFESLSEHYEFVISDFPQEWLPLIYLYDPDLPLYPLLYFHALDPELPGNVRPGERDRVFGFIHHINLEGTDLRVSVALNKNLEVAANSKFIPVVQQQCRARLGLLDVVTLADLSTALTGKLAGANTLIKELWYQIVDRSFGKSLPFGQMWDPVLGLVRFIASWNSEGGRKGEHIQTHFFCQSLGQRIATGGGIHVDFFLLPTFEEFTDTSNPLSLFPRFSDLVHGAVKFCSLYCTKRNIGGLTFSAFNLTSTKTKTKLDTEVVLQIMNRESGRIKDALFENYSAFNRGPQRSIIALMMFNDLRAGSWHPNKLTSAVCAQTYTELGGSYQSPKVIHLYAQQCFGIKTVLPIDIWIKTFLTWPLGFSATNKSKWYEEVFQSSQLWGKIERLIWLAAQSRKVHSSVSADILWCIRYGDPDGNLRGANPMSCKICADHIRAVCPAYAGISALMVGFNRATPSAGFNVETSASNNTTAAQTFVRCSGRAIVDEYSSRDKPERFSPFPVAGHNGNPITVADFINRY